MWGVRVGCKRPAKTLIGVSFSSTGAGLFKWLRAVVVCVLSIVGSSLDINLALEISMTQLVASLGVCFGAVTGSPHGHGTHTSSRR